jgi:hypothetical protein
VKDLLDKGFADIIVIAEHVFHFTDVFFRLHLSIHAKEKQAAVGTGMGSRGPKWGRSFRPGHCKAHYDNGEAGDQLPAYRQDDEMELVRHIQCKSQQHGDHECIHLYQ